MKNLIAIVFVLLPVTSYAAQPIAWPTKFAIQCGDYADKSPYDGSKGTLINVDITGQATQIDPSTLTGYWTGGVGFKFDLIINDIRLTGSTNPVPVTFQCLFFEKLMNQFPGLTSMDCRSNLSGRAALPSKPGFNMFTAKMAIPVPGYLSPTVITEDSVTVRTSTDFNQGNLQSSRFNDETREVSCNYLP